MRETKQIRRIRDMEAKMDEAKAVLERFSAAFKDYVQIQDEMAELEDYYAGDWMKDYEADEAGKLPADLKRGVLSEDALFDLLEENRLAASDVLYAFAQLMSQGAL